MKIYSVLNWILLFSTFISGRAWSQQQVNNPPKYLEKVISHYNKQLSKGLDVYGDDTTSFWMASLNTYTGTYPEDATRPSHIPQRAYLDRYVDAPRGATLYWDMPSIVTAYAISTLTKDDWYEKKAEAYIKDFLSHCVAKNGIFLWGNHYYYDAFRDSTMKFGGKPTAVDITSEKGDLHEVRPILPAWEAFWKISPEATEREIRISSMAHLVDIQTGEFNRHADGKSQHAFLEAGASLVYNLAWLYSKTKDEKLLAQADKIVQYNYKNRNRDTGLLKNNPTSERWDSYTSTTEVGLWTAIILKSAELANETYYEKWVEISDKVLTSFLKYAYDKQENKYYGMLNIADGQPIFRKADDDYPYKPTNYSDMWIPLFPTHNYPMPLAESCLMLYELRGNDKYLQACERWVELIKESLPARQGNGAYAEHYGRVIFYLLNCSEKLGESSYKALAQRVGKEAVDILFAHDMFRGHPGEYRYDAVDGVGILSLSLLWLETGQKPDMLALFF